MTITMQFSVVQPRLLPIALGCALLAALPWKASAQSPAPIVHLPPLQVSGDPPSSEGGQNASDLAKQLQNPISNLISVPFQSNTNFNTGPNKGTQEILNIQPVIPFHINEDWNLITRTILPLIWNPSLQPLRSVPFGTGPITFTAFVSPTKTVGGWVFGAGPVVQIPHRKQRDTRLQRLGRRPGSGSGSYRRRVRLRRAGQQRVLGGRHVGAGGTRYNMFTFNPFINYNFGKGWFVGTVPVITANWRTSGDKAWTLPVGAQIGRLIKIGGKLPVNLLVGAYYNVLRPQFGSTWQLRTQIAFVF